MQDMTEAQIRAHVATLDDERLADFLTAVDAAEIVDRGRSYDLGKSALFYAERLRWPVFPLRPRGKQPLVTHGFKDASLDLTVIGQWWARWPEANIGTPTGRTEQGGCGWDVLDIDGPDGYRSLAEMKHAHCDATCSTVTFCGATGLLPTIGARSLTPGDPNGVTNGRPRPTGAHYFTPAAGTSNTTSGLPGIDLRGDGGYVVLPPSVGPSGGRYSWITRPVLP